MINVWKRFAALPLPLLLLHVTAKFLVGVVVGVLLAGYLKYYWWVILLVGLVLAIPSSYWILSGKQ